MIRSLTTICALKILSTSKEYVKRMCTLYLSASCICDTDSSRRLCHRVLPCQNRSYQPLYKGIPVTLIIRQSYSAQNAIIILKLIGPTLFLYLSEYSASSKKATIVLFIVKTDFSFVNSYSSGLFSALWRKMLMLIFSFNFLVIDSQESACISFRS